MKIRYKKKYLILTIFLVFAFIVAFSVLSGGRNSYEGNTAKAKKGTIQSTLEETGTVFSKRVNTFYSDMSQRVKVLNFSIGDKVKNGDIILTYENSYDLEIERANKQIEAITALYNETVKGADFQEISNLRLNISTIESSLELAKDNLEKIKNLYENSAVSEVEYKEAENNVSSLENQLQEAKNNYDLMMQGVSGNVKKQYEAQIEEIMVQIKIIEQKIEQSSVKAEFDGIITELNVHQGSMTKTGVPVVEIQDENSLGIYVEILAEDTAKIVTGMPFIINAGNNSYELKINRIYPKAESTISELGVEQKRVRIEADFIEDMKIKIGTEVDTVIILEEKKDVLMVDRDAVYEKSKKEYVTVIEDGNEVEREVTTGLKNDDYVEITSGINENEVVLIEY
ncbi:MULTISPECIES: efflux RND transporter periplasmic adaptor subunit [unclassified Sedimentibacter]|uniref:efflux RND transporter periplasmic adaptor subunit n=1 Tax=unclassified Sedimentibacter TaxID=2649220 RepID=UPI0027E2146D|nr:HlyD family efflux transporter periplasmic adaptor subunit [Sedimentibacter sp. MB35-C1]WMJ78423.1 HlyD family efflux transporter periplasmic adaptor subunit [Sedimentibacter sp. MB35-C1]